MYMRFAIVVLAGLVMSGCSSSVLDHQDMQAFDPAVRAYGLFDIGVADVNADGLLDIYTSNHSGTQSVLINEGDLVFEDEFSSLGLDQDPQFPGLAVSPESPEIGSRGIYIYWLGPALVVQFRDMQGIEGSVSVLSRLAGMDADNVAVETEEDSLPEGAVRTDLSFHVKGDGEIRMVPYIHALPIGFDFAGGIDAGDIHVGRGLVSPPSARFSLNMRDRHGMAWAEVDDAPYASVYITRGGLKGTMKDVPLPFWDELFVWNDGSYEDAGKRLGLAKRGCPGRQVAWVDFDSDGLLDVYVVCGRKKEESPNRLFRQDASGRFVDVAAAVGLDIPGNGRFFWLDADRDGDQDLFWADGAGYSLYRNESKVFRKEGIAVNDRFSAVTGLTASDFDNDGDMDIFTTSSGGNRLFINRDGTMKDVSPESAGLPARSLVANWVDYDGDGRQDMHLIPQGMFLQGSGGKFRETGRLGVNTGALLGGKVADARAVWFDADNDGDRDLLFAAKVLSAEKGFWGWLAALRGQRNSSAAALKGRWDVTLFRNDRSPGRWIQLRLRGGPGNRSAVGARVAISTGQTVRLLQVGESGGSSYSQGHYRLYYGDSGEAKPAVLRIEWPDGGIGETQVPEWNRIIEVREQGVGRGAG